MARELRWSSTMRDVFRRRSGAGRRAGVLGATVGIAAAGVAVGVAAQRTVRRRLAGGAAGGHATNGTAIGVAGDPYADEPFGQAPYDEARTVTTADGVEVYVETVDRVDGIEFDATFTGLQRAPAPEPTLVFVHGFCCDMGVFHFQRKALTARGEHRAVYYDQPGHGRSGRLPSGDYQLSALADTLRTVLDEATPDEPVVLVGHSMGGMVVLALAEQHPELFRDRVAGTVLIATAAGQLAAAAGLPELVTRMGRPLLPLVNGATRFTGGAIDRARQASTQLARALAQRYGFGGAHPSRALVAHVEQMNSRTSTDTVTRYLRTLHSHARYPALQALADTPVLLVTGDKDPIIPQRHAEEMREVLPAARLVVVPDSGHMVLLEQHDQVTALLQQFLVERDAPAGTAEPPAPPAPPRTPRERDQ